MINLMINLIGTAFKNIFPSPPPPVLSEGATIRDFASVARTEH